MFFPDLRGLSDVEALLMPEFNLRVECIHDRLEFEGNPEDYTLVNPVLTEDPIIQPVTGQGRIGLLNVLKDLQQEKKQREQSSQGGSS